MLVPFYFLIGGWGEGRRVQATTKFVIYTLVGSLLMLAAAVALGVLSTPEGGEISFALDDLRARTLGEGSQDWIFLLFALAFLVKAPAFPLHGWMPDAYRATPIPVLVLLSGVLSKVGMYGFLRIVLPILPDAALEFQTLMLAIAVISILYGSALAFTSDSARLVLGYSSIAQLGFILLGIFALDLEGKGAQGAVFQMVNHGMVVGPGFLIVGVLAARAGGTDSLKAMGGMAYRAPVLAGLFLIVALASLAMPGSGNFVGELLVLFGAYEDQLVWGLVASVGVVLAAVYMIRLYQAAMHNPLNPAAESRDLTRGELGVIAPLVLVIVAIGVYPHFVTERTEAATARQTVEPRLVACTGGSSFQDPDRPRVRIGFECDGKSGEVARP
jgi:NADH-quinone oxidoreductase subunit M